MWDQLRADFGGDETVNFGPRNETGSALFQVETMATLSCQDQTNTIVPAMDSAVLGDFACFAVNKSLVLNSSSLLSFECEIDEMEWIQDGGFVLVTDRGGSMYLLSGETGDILLSIPLTQGVDGEMKNGKTFRKMILSGSGALVILATNGELMVLQDLDIFKQGGNMEELMKEKLHRVKTTDYQSKVYDAVVHGDYIYTLGGSDSIICKWRIQQNGVMLVDYAESLLKDDAVIHQGCGSSDGTFLFLMDSNAHMTVWDTSLLVCVKQFTDMSVSNICLLETQNLHKNSLEGMRLVVITETESDVCDLVVYSLPQWESVYKLQLTGPSCLAKCSTKQDDIYFTELCGEGKDGSFSTVRFRCLKETDPKTRLHKLLQKNKFEEAMLFSKMYRLNLELVHEVKCNYLLDELSVWNIGKYDEDAVTDMIAQFWECLDKIQDDVLAAKNCIIASLPTLRETRKLHTYCKSRLDKVNVNDPTLKDQQEILLSELLEQRHRLMNFVLAFGENTYMAEKWERFKHADMFQETLSLMQKGQLKAGFIIWSQYQSEWTNKEITSELIVQVLASIPSMTPTAQLCEYLTLAILPVIVREVPTTLSTFIEYVIDKVKRMEETDKKCWPGSAIQFCDYMIQNVGDHVSLSMEDMCMAKETAEMTSNKCETMLEPLRILRVRLQQLDDVINKYKCPLTLTQFLQESRETITFRMLDKVRVTQLIVPTLEKQIRPYMKEHGINQDRIFSRYIKDLLERQGQIRSYTGEVIWEAKAIAIIDCILNAEQKIEGIMEVMKWTPIPWSDKIENLVQMGLKIKHNEVQRLKEQCERVRLRKLLIKYGMRNIEVPQGQDAERLAYVMLKQDQPGCLEDALEVLRSCGVRSECNLYIFRMKEFIYADRIEECLDLIRALPMNIGLEVGRRILQYTAVLLNQTEEIPDLEKKTCDEKRLFTEAAIHIAKYLQSIEHGFLEIEDLEHQEKVLQNIFFLQRDYDLYQSLGQYGDQQTKFDLLMEYIDAKHNPSYIKICWLAGLLQVPQSVLQAKMIVHQASSGNINTAVKISKELLYESSDCVETADLLYEVASCFLTLLSEVEIDDADCDPLRVLPELCSRMADKALSLCHPDDLLKYLSLARSCNTLLSVNQQCELEPNPLSAQWEENTFALTEKHREAFGDLSLDVYQEDALPMSSTIALPLVSKYVIQGPHLHLKHKIPEDCEEEEDDNDIYVSLSRKVLPILQHLRDYGQTQMAFSFIMDGLYGLMKHLHQQNMGFPLSQEKAAMFETEQKSFGLVSSNSQTTLKDFVHSTIVKIFSASKVDSYLAFPYLIILPKRELLELMRKLIKGAGHQYKKLQKVASLGIAVGELLREVSLVSTCQQLEISAQWGYRLSKIKVCFKEALHGPSERKKKLLPLIAQSPLADAQLVKEFCRDFELDVEPGLIMYLSHLFTMEKDLSGGFTYDKQLLLARIKAAIPEIQNQDHLMSEMRAIYYRTSSYDYETLDVVLEVLKTGDAQDIPVDKGITLLEYLKVYTRQSKPTDYEMENRCPEDKKESHGFMNSLPEESKHRLPFHILLHGKAWNIITPELTKQSIGTWLLIAKLLDLSSDQICMTAVQNLIQSYSKSFSEMDGGHDMSVWHWEPSKANTTLLQEVNDVMKNIKNSESFLAVGKWMVKHLPQGSEKVIVLKELIHIAELWHHSISEENRKKEMAKTLYIKLLNQWERMSSAQTLCTHGLGEPDLVQMTKNPAQLVHKLYEHPSISDLDWQKTTTRPDIHGAAEKLCTINSVNFEATQKTILTSFLNSNSNKIQESDETMTFDLDSLKLSESFIEKDEEVNFKRLIHLMERGNWEDNLLLLCQFAYDDNEDSVSRIRALRCMLYMANEKTLRAVCERSRRDIEDTLYVMIYIAGLDKLHVKYTIPSFIKAQKENLVRSLWKNHGHKKTAACVVSSLCLDYEILDQQLWASVLQRLNSFSLMKQLEYVLLRLNRVPKLWHIPALSKMWYIVISNPLSKVCPPLSQEQTSLCVRYFNLLAICPVRQNLDCVGLSRQFKKLELYGCAAGCLLLSKSEDNNQLMEFTKDHSKEILSNLPELLSCGLNYSISQRIKEQVFQHALLTENFMLLMGGEYQTDFINHCVMEKNIDKLLTFGIKHKRLTDCKNLIDLYVSTYPEIKTQLTDHLDMEEDQDDPLMDLLTAYLEMQGLHNISA